MGNNNDFIISQGYLWEYTGKSPVVEIPERVTSIEYRAFYDKRNIIENIVLPDSLEKMNSRFSGLRKLKSIIIPNGIRIIGLSEFSSCVSLESIEISESVTGIFDRAFENCSSLESIALPDSITYLDDDAFADCEKLKNAMIPEGFTLINSTTFSRCGMLCDANGLNIINNVIYNRTNWDKKENLLPIIIHEDVTKIRDNVFVFNSFVNKFNIIIFELQYQNVGGVYYGKLL